jgi:hypothetical protein
VELWLVAVAIGATVVLAAVTYVKRPEQRPIARRGATYALIAALIIGGIVAAYVTTLVNGSEGIFGTIRLGQALTLGVIAGAALGFAYASLNVLILVVGLWFRPSPSWAIGAALATPVIVAAVGFGITAYNAYQYQAQQPQVEAGTMNVELTGKRLEPVVAVGSADCQFLADGGFHMDADLTAADGRLVSVQLGLAADGEVQVLAIGVGPSFAYPGRGWDIGPDTTRLVNGWNHTGGQMEMTDLVPLGADGEPDPTERWSGSLTFGCGAP